MKYSKIILSTVLTLILISTSLCFANINKYKDVSINDSFTIETEKIEANDEFFKSNISYPILKIKESYINKEENNKKVIENINKEISTYIVGFKDRIKKESNEYKKDYENIFSKSGEDYVKYKYEAYSDYKVAYDKNNLISIPIKTYEFTGGAHGMTYLKSYNYDLLSGKELKLKDMFKDHVNYKEVVDTFVKEEINKNKDIYFTGTDGFKGINDNQNFYIDDDGIVIYFQLYDIAPYYVGMPEFKMTYEQFDKYLKHNI